jgi:hypothetical protein
MAIIAAFSASISTIARAECSVSNETTIWGGNERVLIQESKAVTAVRGRVVQNTDPHAPWTGILVEVYDHPEIVLREGPSSDDERKRITGCKTDAMGNFSFNLKPGDYEIRFSCCNGVNVTSMVVRVRKRIFVSRRSFTVHLTLGT